MDTKKMVEAHREIGKCLTGKCDHKSLGKCMDKIADAHKAMAGELEEDAEKAARQLKGDLTIAKFNAIDHKDPDRVRKAASVIGSAEPILID
jgi:hypothetical protein